MFFVILDSVGRLLTKHEAAAAPEAAPLMKCLSGARWQLIGNAGIRSIGYLIGVEEVLETLLKTSTGSRNFQI